MKYDTITDSEGLRKAYDHGDYYTHGKTMYIAGSHTQRDWFDDFTKIPAWGDLRNSERYQKVLEAFQNRGEIDTMVGHSLGGSASSEFQKNYPDRIKNARAYGAPMFDFVGSGSAKTERYRNWFDPVSVLDKRAKQNIKWDAFGSASLTYDYSNIGDTVENAQLVPIDDDEEDERMC